MIWEGEEGVKRGRRTRKREKVDNILGYQSKKKPRRHREYKRLKRDELR